MDIIPAFSSSRFFAASALCWRIRAKRSTRIILNNQNNQKITANTGNKILDINRKLYVEWWRGKILGELTKEAEKLGNVYSRQ